MFTFILRFKEKETADTNPGGIFLIKAVSRSCWASIEMSHHSVTLTWLLFKGWFSFLNSWSRFKYFIGPILFTADYLKNMKTVNQRVKKTSEDDCIVLSFERKTEETQPLANLIGIYFDGCWSVQVPSYLILYSAGRLGSIIASLWKPVKFIMKEGSRSDSGGKSTVVLTFFWQRLCRGNSVSHFH